MVNYIHVQMYMYLHVHVHVPVHRILTLLPLIRNARKGETTLAEKFAALASGIYYNLYGQCSLHKQNNKITCTQMYIHIVLALGYVQLHHYAELKLAQFPTYLSLRGLVRFTECCLLMWRLTKGKPEHKTGAKKVRGTVIKNHLLVNYMYMYIQCITHFQPLCTCPESF